MVQGGYAPRGFAESELRLALSMGRKIIEIPKENEGFWWSWGVVHHASAENLSLDLRPVWGGKSFKFLRKIKDSRGPVG